MMNWRVWIRVAFAFAAGTPAGGCARQVVTTGDTAPPTVLEVENRRYVDLNVFVVPESGSRVRLGLVSGNTTAHFTLPAQLVRGTRELRFQALPIATRSGEIGESILVVPGDTVLLVIPPAE